LEQDQNAGICFDSSIAFKLLNGAVRSPDGANLTEKEKEKEQFPPLCPDFIVEIKSSSDVLFSQENKMAEWLSNGRKLAWLINPAEKFTLVFYNDEVKCISFTETLLRETALNGFELRLNSIFKL
jgi:Uma2 family endonuclease